MHDQQLAGAVATYQIVRERIQAIEVDIDERTLADTLEGLTDVHEIISEVVRSALLDEAMVEGLKLHMGALHDRLNRLSERADAKRDIARNAMADLSLHKISGPDFTLSLRTGQPGLVVIDEAAIPGSYFEARAPRLKRMDLLTDLKRGVLVTGASLSEPTPVLSVRVR